MCSKIDYIAIIQKHDIKGEKSKYFKRVGEFINGYTRVENEKSKVNYIDKSGHLVSKTWFEWVGSFFNGYAAINEKGQSKYIDRSGIISP